MGLGVLPQVPRHCTATSKIQDKIYGVTIAIRYVRLRQQGPCNFVGVVGFGLYMGFVDIKEYRVSCRTHC